MSFPSAPQAEGHAASLAENNLARVAQIDRSLSSPVVLLTVLAALWLVLGSALALIASLKLHLPEFLNTETLTYGRVRALQQVALGYGWSFNAALAVALWMMHRLGRVELRQGWVAVLGALGWNAALAYGLFAIALGQQTGVDWLEMPREVGPVLGVSFLLVGLWSVVAFSRRQTSHVYASQWYILAAMFCLPVLFLGAQVMLLWFPARGAVQAIASGWYTHGVVALFLAPVAIAALYYVVPKVLARPLRAYYLAVVGFWTFVLFGGWAGVQSLVGGPIPVWLQSTSVVAAVMTIIPVFITAINLHGTLAGGWSRVWRDPVLSFAGFGALCLTLSGLVGAFMSTRSVSVATRFTDFTVGHAQHVAHGFIAMALFAVLYYALPRLARREWPSAALIRTHFWLCALGTVGVVAALSVHGWIQGAQWNAAVLTPAQIAAASQPWNVAVTAGSLLMTLGHLVFCGHVLWLLAPRGERRDDSTQHAR